MNEAVIKEIAEIPRKISADVLGCVDILKLHSFLFLIKLQQLSARHFIKYKH